MQPNYLTANLGKTDFLLVFRLVPFNSIFEASTICPNLRLSWYSAMSGMVTQLIITDTTTIPSITNVSPLQIAMNDDSSKTGTKYK